MVAHWSTEPARVARFAPLPSSVPAVLGDALAGRGIQELYRHQVEAYDALRAGRNPVIVTPTASGKSLCYNLPILSEMLSERSKADEDTRPTALYLFPTKALSQDQVAELNELLAAMGEDAQAAVAAFTYDGDTPQDQRRVLRERGDIVVTNPFMLHVSILPNHVRWGHFLRRLSTVVIDELHVYQGVYGSSVGNVLRRLKRLCKHYGASPRFIACSATIGNPGRHFARLVEEEPFVIDESGAPSAERHHVFLNPPLVNEALGLRARAIDQVRAVARVLLTAGVPSLFFGQSRNGVEVITKYLKDLAQLIGLREEQVVGYRGGYLPDLRREIERGLRAGDIRAVAATNALELGVDIGSLDAVVLCGYPGTVSSYRQQSGRAGRRSGTSVSVLIATSNPMDQYVLANPADLLEGVGAEARIHPDNLVLATSHLECAVFELPFEKGETFGTFAETQDVLEILSEPGGVILRRGDQFHWMDEKYPAESVSLDLLDSDSFLVLEHGRAKSLGHVDRTSAATTIHVGAIYQHQGTQYQVKVLDWEGRRAYAERASVDYYTQAETQTDIQVLVTDDVRESSRFLEGHGEVHVTVLATMFKKIRFYTHENLETGPIQLPPEEMDTTAFWIVISEELEREVSLAKGTRGGAVQGLANLLRGVAPIYLRLGPRDLRAVGFSLHRHFGRPTIMLYDGVPGGVGFAEILHDRARQLYHSALSVLRRCPCRLGCPSCIGIGRDLGEDAKRAAEELLTLFLAEAPSTGGIASKKTT